jgi:hypothetical protein
MWEVSFASGNLLRVPTLPRTSTSYQDNVCPKVMKIHVGKEGTEFLWLPEFFRIIHYLKTLGLPS